MKQKIHAPQNRVIFFDNLRYLMVLLVLVFHTGASYGSLPSFWPYRDPNPSEFIDHIMPLLDVFMMSILFFIAGYFALPSLQKTGGRRFLEGKFKRLGIPWLVVTILVLPVLDYIHYYTQSLWKGLLPRKYGTHWWLSIKKIAELHIGPMRMAEYLDMTLGDLIEGIVLHVFEGKIPFDDKTLKKIGKIKKVYDLDLDSTHSHKLTEPKPK